MGNRLTAVAACLTLAMSEAVAQAPDTAWVARSVVYEVFVRDFSSTGDLRGVREGLDRIAAAGANVVWLMPVQPIGVLNRKEALGSPYSLRDYRAIDSAFGTPADFHALVRAVHARGMKIILDWVPDHTAWDHPWIRAHPEYYVRNERGEISVPRNPEGQLTDWTDVAQLDYRNADLRRVMIAEMRYWLDEYGIDGFRVDMAGFLPHAFWREAVPALRAAVPRRLLMLAEWEDRAMHQLGFDLTYGWDAYHRLKDVFRGATADTFLRVVTADLAAMPAGGMRLRFTTNHDETAWDKPPVILFGGPAAARAAFVAMALLPGRPMLYNGQEVESPQTLRLFYRDTVIWNQPGADAARAFYRRVLDLSRTHRAFGTSDFSPVATSAPADVIAYRRGGVVVLVNVRDRPVEATVSGAAVDRARDLLSRRIQRGAVVSLPAYGAAVLELRGATGR